MVQLAPTGAPLCDAETGACELPLEPTDEAHGSLEAGAVRVVCVTDPLCSGCWALEPAWRRLLHHYGDVLAVTYVYGGLLPSWDGFRDRGAGIASPADVAPHWNRVSERSGQPIDARVWLDDPPESSFPACVAAVAVRLVAPEQEEPFLRRLRELVFLERRNIARPEVLAEALDTMEIDSDAWRAAIDDGRAERTFQADRGVARMLGARVFPTLLVASGSRPPRLVSEGTVGPEQLESALLEVAGAALGPRREAPSAAAALSAYGTGTTAEFAALLEVPASVAERSLAAAGAQWRPVGRGKVWEP